MKNLSYPDEVIYLRNELREARAAALSDAEGFAYILFALERLGFLLSGQELLENKKLPGLGNYIIAIEELAKKSPLVPRHYDN